MDDNHLREVFLTPIRKCARYKPAFGKGRTGGFNLAQFQTLYGADAFYAWLGLDSPSVYAAHKAAGGLTSVYRQVGVGCERVFRELLISQLELTPEQSSWSYTYEKPRGGHGTHTLDARISTSDLKQSDRKRFREWLRAAQQHVATSSAGSKSTSGAVFEVRQGYKSADAKRQNADLRFGGRAYQAGLLPVFTLMSAQISEPVVRRYRADGMLVLTGELVDDPLLSTFAFADQIVGFDLASFFERNSATIAAEIKGIVESLLAA